MGTNISYSKIKIRDLDYLRLLSETYPTISEATTEIINLQAILDLPKGTEHFISDVHLHIDTNNCKGGLCLPIMHIFYIMYSL